jgi:CheY-like chemotaxis protein
MNDQATKLFAGQMGICAVLVNVLIDKGIVTQREMRERFEQAREAASQCSGGLGVAHAVAEMIEYLEPQRDEPCREVVPPPALQGRIILVVEEQPKTARELQTALEQAGADVLLAGNCAEALLRIQQFDLSAAVLDWRPEISEHPIVIRQLKKEGVRFLLYTSRPPEHMSSASRAPIFAKSTAPAEIAKALAQLIATDDATNNSPLLTN